MFMAFICDGMLRIRTLFDWVSDSLKGNFNYKIDVRSYEGEAFPYVEVGALIGCKIYLRFITREVLLDTVHRSEQKLDFYGFSLLLNYGYELTPFCCFINSLKNNA